MAWWRPRRDRRVAALGGLPVRTGRRAAEHEIVPFTPAPLDEAAARREIEHIVAGLAPHAVDEATGHILDGLIDRWADRWAGDVDLQFAAYQAGAAYRADGAAASLAQHHVLRGHDQRRLAQSEFVLAAALADATGRAPSTVGRRESA